MVSSFEQQVSPFLFMNFISEDIPYVDLIRWERSTRANWQKSFEKSVAEFDQFPWFCKNKGKCSDLKFWKKKRKDKGKKRRARKLMNSRYIFNCFEYDHSNKPHIVSDPVMHYFTRHFTMAALLFKRSLGWERWQSFQINSGQGTCTMIQNWPTAKCKYICMTEQLLYATTCDFM